MKTIAIITARGGSKRIPRKNIKPFLGRPIIEYSILAAIESGIFDEVMVSTDDEEIATFSKSVGANVPFMRSMETSNDFAITAEVLLEVIERYKALGKEFETVACIYPTAPFVTAEKLRIAYHKLMNSSFDTVIPITRFSFPILRSFKVENEKVEFNWPEYALTRSQDIPPAFHDCGQFYFLKAKEFSLSKSLVSNNTTYIEVPESEVQDIDNEEDWRIAELKLSWLKSNRTPNV